MIPVGTDSHQIDCLVTLSSSIGPNISALSISWLHNNRIIDLSQDRVQVSETFGAHTTFISSLTLSDISQHDSGEYCCTANIAGNQTKSKDCVELKVKTDGECNRVAETHLTLLLSDSVTISGNFKNLRVGSTVQLMCSVPNLTDSTINWLSHDGSVVSSSGALILQSVNYTINGRMFTCSVNSPQLTNSINETITVTVQGEHNYTNCINCNLIIFSLQQHQLVMSLLSTHHHMLLMVTRMLSCSVLSH